MRQSKTTIKELTAQYRAVLKHAFFAGIAAVALSTTDAMAEINVASGETDITSGVINAINTSINNNAPDKSKFSYTAPDGTTTIKLSDDTQYVAADYKTDSTSKDNTYGITGPTSVNWESNLTAANYTYTPLTADGTAGTPVTGDTAVNHLTKTVETSALHSLYSGASLALSSDSTATETLNTLDYSTTSGGNSYYLYKDGADFKLVTDKANPTTTIVTDPSAIGVSGVLNDLTEAYKGDAEKVANIQKTLNDSYKTNTDSYDYINNTTTGYLAKDKANAEALKINKGSLDTANSGFSIAQTNYNGSVGQAIDGHILNEDGAVAKLFNEKEANMSEQLGYNIANNPANPDAEGSLVNALTMNEGKTEGKVTSVVGAINANTDAIATKADKSEVDDLTEYVGQHSGDGVEATGLTKLVEDNASEITTLIGGESITGSVKNTVKTAVDALANGAVKDNADAIAQVRSDAEAAWEKGEKWISQELGYNTKTTDAKTELAEAGFESTDFLGAVTENKEAIAQVRSDAEAAWEKGEKWISQELGYDTKTTDAKTELAEAGFESTDFLGAVTENKEAIAQVRSDAEAAWEKGEKWISQELGYDTKTTDAKTELAKVGFESTDFLGALQELDQTDLALSGKIADEATRATAEELQIRNDFTAADEITLNTAKAYTDASNALTLNQARAYTDERVEKLNKDLSSGIASAIALSSVPASGVQKGEVAVSGGYGYYNGQSAAAFGATMGLSNAWSVNAGAGVSGSDLSFRAGTTYKFKLF